MLRQVPATAASAAVALALHGLLLLASCAGQGGPNEPTTPSPVPMDPRLAGVETFALALGVPLGDDATAARLAPFDLVVLDGEGATRELVDALHADGGLVLGYLSVGTIEPWRSWSAAAEPYRLERWEDWGEYYADVSDPGFRALMVDQVAPGVLASGVDGLFLDNTDMVAGHPAQAAGMVELVAALAELVHGSGRLLFAQNGDGVVGPIVEFLDGWNREDVSSTYYFDDDTYGPVTEADTAAAQATLRRLRDAGLLVSTTDYVAEDDVDATRRAIDVACEAGAVPFVADVGLSRLPVDPFRC